MNKSVQLPFCVPVYASTPIISAIGLAIQDHPTAYNAVLNQCISIQCRKNFIRTGYSSPEMFIQDINFTKFPFIIKNTVDLKYAYPFFLDIVKKMLDDGNYIYYENIDDFYMPGKSWYAIRHLHHSGVICGYDDSDNTLSIAAYDINWVYNLIRIPQSCVVEGLLSSLEAGRSSTIWAYKAKADEVLLDQDKILSRLKEYLASDFEKYPPESAKLITGIVVHDYLAIYMNKLKDGSILHDKMDWRVLRPVWEQKKCMLDRIRAVEKENKWTSDLSEKYVPIVEKANHIRVMYALYHKKPRPSIMDMISNELIKIKNTEKEILEELIERMESKKDEPLELSA